MRDALILSGALTVAAGLGWHYAPLGVIWLGGCAFLGGIYSRTRRAG